MQLRRSSVLPYWCLCSLVVGKLQQLSVQNSVSDMNLSILKLGGGFLTIFAILIPFVFAGFRSRGNRRWEKMHHQLVWIYLQFVWCLRTLCGLCEFATFLSTVETTWTTIVTISSYEGTYLLYTTNGRLLMSSWSNKFVHNMVYMIMPDG